MLRPGVWANVPAPFGGVITKLAVMFRFVLVVGVEPVPVEPVPVVPVVEVVEAVDELLIVIVPEQSEFTVYVPVNWRAL
jgi:hypothetical protein